MNQKPQTLNCLLTSRLSAAGAGARADLHSAGKGQVRVSGAPRGSSFSAGTDHTIFHDTWPSPSHVLTATGSLLHSQDGTVTRWAKFAMQTPTLFLAGSGEAAMIPGQVPLMFLLRKVPFPVAKLHNVTRCAEFASTNLLFFLAGSSEATSCRL